MESIKNDLVPKGGGVVKREDVYQYVSKFSQEAVDTLIEIMRTSRNEALKMGAAKTLLDKCIPDLKATEVTGEQGGAVLVRLITEADAKSNSGSTDQELSGSADDL